MKRTGRFSVRTLLLVTLVLAIYFGWKSHTVRIQRLTSEFILSRHGYIGYDYEYNARAYLKQTPVSRTNEALIKALGIDWLHSIVWVELSGNPVGDQEIAKVTRLNHIRGLVVSGYEVPTNDDDGVKYIPPAITASSLERIGRLRQLQRLKIDVGEADAKGMAGWHELSNLEQLTLSSARDSYVAHLAQIPNLKRVELWGNVTEEGLLPLAELPSLQELQVPAMSISTETRDLLTTANPKLKVVDSGSSAWKYGNLLPSPDK